MTEEEFRKLPVDTVLEQYYLREDGLSYSPIHTFYKKVRDDAWNEKHLMVLEHIEENEWSALFSPGERTSSLIINNGEWITHGILEEE